MLAGYEMATDGGEDYTDLKRFLVAGQWQQADRETAFQVLKLARREVEGWLRTEDIARIPIIELRSLNQLWLESSNERFGFSVQQQIWQDTQQNYTEFGDRIGWRQSDSWLNYSDLSFNLQAATGHLPALPLPIPIGREYVFSFVLGKWRIALLLQHGLRT